jgi:hypothetical protein
MPYPVRRYVPETGRTLTALVTSNPAPAPRPYVYGESLSRPCVHPLLTYPGPGLTAKCVRCGKTWS